MADVRISRDAALRRCRNHPFHQQSPGVCSLCLGEGLSRLSPSSSSFSFGKKPSSRKLPGYTSSPSSVSTYNSSSSDSSYCRTPLRRLVDEAKSGPLLLFGVGKDGNLKKSRSTAAAKVDGATGTDEKVGRKKSRGFWWKLVNRRKESVNNDGLKPCLREKARAKARVSSEEEGPDLRNKRHGPFLFRRGLLCKSPTRLSLS